MNDMLTTDIATLAIESGAGALISIAASVLILWVLSNIKPIQQIVFPSEDESRAVEGLLNRMAEPEEMEQLASAILFAGLCMRYLGKVIFVGLVFMATLNQFGNFV